MAVQYRQGDIAVILLRATEHKIIDAELFHNAALFNQPQVLRFILEKRPELLEARNEIGETPLTSAAQGRAYMAAKVLLENGAREDIGQSLVLAVGEGREIAYLIMQRHRDWIANDQVVGDILGTAIEYTDEAFLQFLLEFGVTPNIRDSEGYFVLLHAPQHEIERLGQGNWEFMVRHGANERQAICSIESSHLEGIEEHAPRWFASKVSEMRPTCAPD